MAASSTQFRGKEHKSESKIQELVPISLNAIMHGDLQKIIYDYAFDAGDVEEKKVEKKKEERKESGEPVSGMLSLWLKPRAPLPISVWLKQPATTYTFFGIPTSERQILALAEYAGSLQQIESYIRQAHARKEPHLQGTLMRAISLAVRGLDQSIHDETGAELDKGMAEKLLELHAELFPADQSKALEQAKRAAPLEDEKTIAFKKN